MAVDIFLKLDGVTGEAKDDAHKGEIDVLAWSWGLSQSGTTHVGGGAGAGKVAVQDLSITKYVDQATPTLHLFCANGKHIANGQLTIRKAGENPLEYLKLEMEELIISGISSGGSAGEDRHTEHMSLNFRKFKKTYTTQNDDGSAGAAPEASWDIAANKSS
jgi:type VI secretion system secreted protein Hcp